MVIVLYIANCPDGILKYLQRQIMSNGSDNAFILFLCRTARLWNLGLKSCRAVSTLSPHRLHNNFLSSIGLSVQRRSKILFLSIVFYSTRDAEICFIIHRHVSCSLTVGEAGFEPWTAATSV
jgi:hypothetical protein